MNIMKWIFQGSRLITKKHVFSALSTCRELEVLERVSLLFTDASGVGPCLFFGSFELSGIEKQITTLAPSGLATNKLSSFELACIPVR